MTRDIDNERSLWREGAKAYICGSRMFQKSVRTSIDSFLSKLWEEQGLNEEEIKQRRVLIEAEISQRAVSDVFD